MERCLACRKLQEEPPVQCSRKRKKDTLLCSTHVRQKKIRYFPDESFANRIKQCWKKYKLRQKIRQRVLLKNKTDFVTGESHWEIEESNLYFWDGFFAHRESILEWINHERFIHDHETKPRNPYSLTPLPEEVLAQFPIQGIKRTEQQPSNWKMSVLNCFRTIDDHGYYTNPAWILEQSPRKWHRFIQLIDQSIEEINIHSKTYERILQKSLYPFADYFDMEATEHDAIGIIFTEFEKLIREQDNLEDRKLCCWWILDSLQHIVEGGIEGITETVDMDEAHMSWLNQLIDIGVPVQFMMHTIGRPFRL